MAGGSVPGIKRNLLSDAQNYVLNLFNSHAETKLVYHNYQYTAEIVDRVKAIAQAMDLNEEMKEVALISAWFHATGFLFDYDQSTPKSVDLAKGFLTAEQYSTKLTELIISTIETTAPNGIPETLEEQILADAIAAQNYSNDFFEKSPLLRLEWELSQGRRTSNYEWHQIQLQNQLHTRFYTPYAKKEYGPIAAQNLLIQKTKAEKTKLLPNQLIDEKEGQLRNFQSLERKVPTSATQTFFRTNYRNHINLSAIADNKANIMISVNAILISVVISILSYRNIPDTNPMVLLPVVIFLVTGLTSLICAVLSIRPKVTTPPEGPINLEEAKKNIVFFGNFVQLNLEQYENAVDAVLRDGELLYGNMTRDLYFLGKVLDKKYRYLTMSYNIFMVGFIATVATFLVAIFL